uniref:Uncharacterized protein n=1 Tax=Equus asinus TaxID=9793 RepID=A0A8C4L963_EQUAS
MSLTRTGPGPVWAKAGEMVTVSLGLFPHVPSLGLEPCKDLRWPGLGLWASVSPFCNRLGLSLGPMLTDSTSISVIFQKAFQKCTSRFCVIRSNSAPRSSGSMAKRPLCSPKDTSPMEMVCRNGRMAGVNCGEMPLRHPVPRRGRGASRSEGQRRGGGMAQSFSKHLVSSHCVPGTALVPSWC